MKLLVGLGNPGAQYARNRHNVGYMAVEAVAHAHGFGPWRRRFQADTSEGRVGGEQILLVKPMTYMNESGRAVGEAMRFYKLAPGNIVVFHDELDLAPGKVKVKVGGGHAGHNGLRSIEDHIGADFQRVRIGIGHPGHKDMVHSYVLHDFSREDQDWLPPLLDAIANAMSDLVGGNESRFMSRIGLTAHREPRRTSRPGPARASEIRAQPAPAKAAVPPPKAKAGPGSKAKAPSQRDLARVSASRHNDRPKPAARTEESAPSAPPRTEGALAGMLRRWLGRD